MVSTKASQNVQHAGTLRLQQQKTISGSTHVSQGQESDATVGCKFTKRVQRKAGKRPDVFSKLQISSISEPVPTVASVFEIFNQPVWHQQPCHNIVSPQFLIFDVQIN